MKAHSRKQNTHTNTMRSTHRWSEKDSCIWLRLTYLCKIKGRVEIFDDITVTLIIGAIIKYFHCKFVIQGVHLSIEELGFAFERLKFYSKEHWFVYIFLLGKLLIFKQNCASYSKLKGYICPYSAGNFFKLKGVRQRNCPTLKLLSGI